MYLDAFRRILASRADLSQPGGARKGPKDFGGVSPDITRISLMKLILSILASFKHFSDFYIVLAHFS